ncbi:hypothetical protein HMPREF1233_1603 [Streptococcus pyogenes GA19700]|nr:hypothetical protein HMPREF1233_1603 [Streptococcus pyogenes GA19700]
MLGTHYYLTDNFPYPFNQHLLFTHYTTSPLKMGMLGKSGPIWLELPPHVFAR